MPFCLESNFCDKIFVNLSKFYELLVPNTLAYSFTSHAFCEETFVNEIIVILE